MTGEDEPDRLMVEGVEENLDRVGQEREAGAVEAADFKAIEGNEIIDGDDREEQSKSAITFVDDLKTVFSWLVALVLVMEWSLGVNIGVVWLITGSFHFGDREIVMSVFGALITISVIQVISPQTKKKSEPE